jgi:hypothetical protein
VAIWAVAFVLIFIFLPSWESRGQFGDLFGVVNALFSGLAFAALYSSIRMQQFQLELQMQELILQRDELRLQREEMIASRGELANQVRVQRAQFEASVAQVIVASEQVRIEAIKMECGQTHPSGREAYVRRIEEIADGLEQLGNRLEERAKGAV